MQPATEVTLVSVEGRSERKGLLWEDYKESSCSEAEHG